MKVRFHPQATREFRAAEWYIDERRPRWGLKFRERVMEAIRFAGMKTGRCIQPYGPDFCSVKVDRFPYRVYYRWSGEWRDIYAEYHASRKELGWQGRTFQ